MIFTKYDTATGNVTGIVSVGSVAEAAASCGAGESYVTGRANPATQRVIGGYVVSKPQSEIDAADIARAWGDLKSLRNDMLARTDWTQVADAPVDHAAWAAYRQALRDLPANTTDPRNPVWPSKPQS